MFQWQSAWCLLIATLAFAIAVPALAQDTTGAAGDDTATSATDAVDDAAPTSARRKRRDPTDWTDWRNYRPSIAGGFGVTFDKVNSTVDGTTKYAIDANPGPCRPAGAANFKTCVDWYDEFDSFVEGGAFYLDGRIDLPEFDIPSRPRLFASVAFVAQNQDSKPLSYEGFPRESWTEARDYLGQDINGEATDPFVRIEQTFDPQNLLFVGIGASFLLPMDSYPIRLNANVNYYRSKSRVSAFHDWASKWLNPSTERTVSLEEDMVTQGIAPGAGMDVELGSVGWVTFGFFANVFVGIPMSGNEWDTTLFNGSKGAPGYADVEGFNDYALKRELNISTFVGLRFEFGED